MSLDSLLYILKSFKVKGSVVSDIWILPINPSPAMPVMVFNVTKITKKKENTILIDLIIIFVLFEYLFFSINFLVKISTKNITKNINIANNIDIGSFKELFFPIISANKNIKIKDIMLILTTFFIRFFLLNFLNEEQGIASPLFIAFLAFMLQEIKNIISITLVIVKRINAIIDSKLKLDVSRYTILPLEIWLYMLKDKSI